MRSGAVYCIAVFEFSSAAGQHALMYRLVQGRPLEYHSTPLSLLFGCCRLRCDHVACAGQLSGVSPPVLWLSMLLIGVCLSSLKFCPSPLHGPHNGYLTSACLLQPPSQHSASAVADDSGASCLAPSALCLALLHMTQSVPVSCAYPCNSTPRAPVCIQLIMVTCTTARVHAS